MAVWSSATGQAVMADLTPITGPKRPGHPPLVGSFPIIAMNRGGRGLPLRFCRKAIFGNIN